MNFDQQLLENTDCMFTIKREDGSYVHANALFLEFIGMEWDDVQDHTDIELFSDPLAGYLAQGDAVILANHDRLAYQPLFEFEGQERLLSFHKFPVTEGGERYIGTRIRNEDRYLSLKRQTDDLVFSSVRSTQISKALTEQSLAMILKLTEVHVGLSRGEYEQIGVYMELLLNELRETPYDPGIHEYLNRKDKVNYIGHVRRAAPLFDIGLALLDNDMVSRAVLTEDEKMTMRSHTILGHALLQEVCNSVRNFRGQTIFSLAAPMALCHHERWDGQGYPNGLVGDEIPYSAQALALVQYYSARTMPRVYREDNRVGSHEEVMADIGRESGKMFNPAVVRAWFEIEDQVRAASLRTTGQLPRASVNQN